eukprot:gnl/Chilomastix_cuspidata/1556.p3 GENE.gnl/Chilomastix_cuspidata/1556~~gnl/Chilomastix_cuspidata/1556.p3  ORF type:complete len:480 (-),score=62.13 gnl/Chilomastix_cuspidata/1556:14647-16086(-)
MRGLSERGFAAPVGLGRQRQHPESCARRGRPRDVVILLLHDPLDRAEEEFNATLTNELFAGLRSNLVDLGFLFHMNFVQASVPAFFKALVEEVLLTVLLQLRLLLQVSQCLVAVVEERPLFVRTRGRLEVLGQCFVNLLFHRGAFLEKLLLDFVFALRLTLLELGFCGFLLKTRELVHLDERPALLLILCFPFLLHPALENAPLKHTQLLLALVLELSTERHHVFLMFLCQGFAGLRVRRFLELYRQSRFLLLDFSEIVSKGFIFEHQLVLHVVTGELGVRDGVEQFLLLFLGGDRFLVMLELEVLQLSVAASLEPLIQEIHLALFVVLKGFKEFALLFFLYFQKGRSFLVGDGCPFDPLQAVKHFLLCLSRLLQQVIEFFSLLMLVHQRLLFSALHLVFMTLVHVDHNALVIFKTLFRADVHTLLFSVFDSKVILYLMVLVQCVVQVILCLLLCLPQRVAQFVRVDDKKLRLVLGRND